MPGVDQVQFLFKNVESNISNNQNILKLKTDQKNC